MSFLNDEQLKYLNGIGLQGTKSSKKIRQGTSELENLLRNDPIAADMYSYGAGGALQQGANSETAGNGFLGWLKDSADAGAASVVGGTARTLGEFMPFGQVAFNSAADYMDEVARRNSPTEELTGMNYVASAIGNALGSGGATMAETAALIGAGKLLGLGGLASGALGLASKAPGLGTLVNAGKAMWQSPYGKYLVANVAGSPLEAVAESGNLITDMRNENAQAGYSKYSDEEIRNAALRSAGLNTAWLTAANMLEAGALGKITGALAGNVGERTAKQIARQAILGGGSSAISEGGEEYFQNLIGDYSKRGNIKDLNYDEALEAAKMGAIGGGVLGGIGAGGSALFDKYNKSKGDVAEEVTSEGESKGTEENFWDNKENARKAIKDAYSNGMLSKDDARNLLIKLDNGEIGPEAEKVQKERAKQTEQLLEKQRLQGYDDELDQYANGQNVVEETAPSPAPEPVIQGLTQQQGPQLFDNTLSNVFAQADKDKENAAREAFIQAILSTPTGKGVMPEIINSITGDAFSQPFSLGTITKATQNKALGATPSAYTSRKAMATGNAAKQAINFPAQAGLNQSNMPIGSAQNLRQQVNAVNLALAANRGATDKTAFQQQPAQQPSDVNATVDRLMAEQAITNLFDNARLLPPEYYANRAAQQQAQAELAERRKALANILGNVATQKWDETQQEYGNRRQQALQNIANIVNARAAGKRDKLESTNASKQQSVQGIANIVNALAAGRFDKKAEARQAIANIVNARAAQQWDQAEKGTQNEKTEQKRETAKNTQGAKTEEKQNAQANQNVKQPKDEKPVEKKPEKIEEPKTETKGKANLPEGVTVEVNYNEEKNGVELKFNKSPGKEVTSKLSASGYRWSKQQQHWWAKQTNAGAMDLARQLEGADEKPIPKPSNDKVNISNEQSKQQKNKEAIQSRAAQSSNPKVELVQDGKRIKISFPQAPLKEAKDLLIENGFIHPVGENYWHHPKDEQGVKVARMFDPEWVKHYLNPATNKQDLTTQQDKFDFKREDMTEAFGKLLGIDSVMSYDDAVKKFGENRLNEGQVVLHIPNSKLYFIVEKYNEDDTAKHGMKYHVDAFDSKLDYDVNNVFDAKNENVVAERVRNPKGDNKPLQWQGRTPEDWMLQEVDRTITDWRGEKRTVDNISYSGGQWWATFDNGSTMSMESLEEYNRQLQNLTNNKEKALALTEKPQTQATATTFKDNPESLINEDALNNMSLDQLNAINDMFEGGKDKTNNATKPKAETTKPTKKGSKFDYGNKDVAVNDLLSSLGLKKKKDKVNDVEGIDYTDDGLDDAFKELNKELSKLSANPMFNPSLYRAAAKVGLIILKRVGKSFAKWAKMMLDTFKKKNPENEEKIKPYLGAIYKNIENWPSDLEFKDDTVEAACRVVGGYYSEGLTNFDDIYKALSDNAGEEIASQLKGYLQQAFYAIDELENPTLSVDNNVVKSNQEDTAKGGNNNENLSGRQSGGVVEQEPASGTPKGTTEREQGGEATPTRTNPASNERPEGTGRTGTGRTGGYSGAMGDIAPQNDAGPSSTGNSGINSGDAIQSSVSEQTGSGETQEPRPAGENGTTERSGELPTPVPRRTINKGQYSILSNGNYHANDQNALLGNGKHQPQVRFSINIKAIEALKRYQENGIEPTPEEKHIMAQYSGWGGMKDLLFDGTWEHPKYAYSTNGFDWQEANNKLRALLGQKAWENAWLNVSNQYYTPPNAISKMWELAERLGFKGGKVLEPSMGVGNFYALMPAKLQKDSVLTGVEIDPIAGEMAKVLYPDGHVFIQGYEKHAAPENFYDFIIGNVPFGENILKDSKYSAAFADPLQIHDFFLVKNMGQLQPGGILMAITTHNTLDKVTDTVRAHLAQQAELVGAIRLPNNTFGGTGTSVLTDIVVFKKRQTPIKIEEALKEPWVKANVEEIVFRGEDKKVNKNNYFNLHPEMVAGTERYTSGRYGPEIGVVSADVEGDIDKAISNFPKNVMKKTDTKAKNEYVSADLTVKDRGLYYNKKGELVYRDGIKENKVTLEDYRFTVKEKESTLKLRQETVASLMGVYNKYNELIKAEKTQDPNLENIRKEALAEWNNHVKKYGYYVKYTQRKDGGTKVLLNKEIKFFSRIGDSEKFIDLAALDYNNKPAPILLNKITTVYNMGEPNVSNAYLKQLFSGKSVLDIDQLAEDAQVTKEQAIKELIAQNAAYKTPTGEYQPTNVYLSGNVVVKLNEAKAAYELGDKSMKRNIDALEKIRPKLIPAVSIDVSLGVSWVDTEDYEEFIANLLGYKTAMDCGVSVTNKAGQWIVNITDKAALRSPLATDKYGMDAPFVNFTDFLEAAMNKKHIEIKKEVRDGYQKRYEFDEEGTKIAEAKIKNLHVAFKNWLWFQDYDRKVKMELQYNDRMNAIVPPVFDASLMQFDGLIKEMDGKPFDPRKHQRDFVLRALLNGRGAAYHEAGTGKTLIMAMLCHELKRTGKSKKPLILAHNANAAQVAKDIKTFYPTSKVLYIPQFSGAKGETAVTKRLIGQMKSGDWDAIVIPHQAIYKIAFSEDTLKAVKHEELEAIKEQIVELSLDEDKELLDDSDFELTEADIEYLSNKKGKKKKDDEEEKLPGSMRSSEKVRRAMMQYKKMLLNIQQQAENYEKPDYVSFEDTGIDSVLVDECHMFKKTPKITKREIKGVDTGTSAWGFQMSCITDYINVKNNNKGVFLFSGTMITNTIPEIHTMMKFVMPDSLKQANIYNLDDFLNTFTGTSNDIEITADGTWDQVERLTKFCNITELRQIAGQDFDIVTTKGLPGFELRALPNGKTLESEDLTDRERDELLNGRTENPKGLPNFKIQNIVIPKTRRTQAVTKAIQKIAKTWKNAEGKEKAIMAKKGLGLKLQTLPGAVGMSIKNLDPSFRDVPKSKVNLCVKNVKEIYDSHPKACQVIFTEKGYGGTVDRTYNEVITVPSRKGPKAKIAKSIIFTLRGYNMVEDIKQKLIAEGIPENEIAVVDGSTNKDNMRAEIAERVSAAEIRVVIGSSQTLGVGVNMQKNLRAAHNLDAVWQPGDLDQMNKRSKRQGNCWNTVLNYRYITPGLDGKKWTALAQKQAFISVFTDKDSNVRVIDSDALASADSDEGVNVNDIVESLTSAVDDARALQREKLKYKLEQYSESEVLFQRGREDAVQERSNLERTIIPNIQKTIDGYKEDIKVAQSNKPKEFSVKIKTANGWQTFTDRKKAESVLKTILTSAKKGEKYCEFNGFNVTVENLGVDGYGLTAHGTNGNEYFTMSGTFAGLSQILANIPKKLAKAEEQLANYKALLKIKIEDAEAVSPYKDIVITLRNKLAALEKDMQDNPVPAPEWFRLKVPIDTYVDYNGNRYLVTGYSTKDDTYSIKGSYIDDNGLEKEITFPANKAFVDGFPVLTNEEMKIDPKQEILDDSDDVEGYEEDISKAVAAVNNIFSEYPNYTNPVKVIEKIGRKQTDITDQYKLEHPATQYSVAQTAYHGTNRIFNKFTLDHMREGAGGLTHGYGLYFTADERVAEEYRQNISGTPVGMEMTIDGVRYRYDREADVFVGTNGKKISANDNTPEGLIARAFTYNEDAKDALEILSKDNSANGKKAYAMAKEANLNITKGGATYEALIPDDNEIIDEESRFSEQPKDVQRGIEKTFKSIGASNYLNEIKSNDAYGNEIYAKLIQAIMGDNATIEDYADFVDSNSEYAEQASKLLNQNGVKGLHYWEKADGDAYVVFSDEAIKIQRQYMAGNISADTLRPRAEIEAEIRTAFPSGTITYENGVPVVTLPNGAKFQYSIRKNIIVNAREQKKADSAHGTSGGAIQGFWQKFSGNGVQRLLAVAQNSERGTAFHEAMHAAIDLALTEKEANALRKYYQNKAKEQNRNVDEVIADAYRDWVLARQQKRGTAFGKLWQKIKDFCVRIRSLFDNGAEVKRIMQDVESGKVYERGANNGNGMKRQNAQGEKIQYSVAASKSKIASAFTNTERKGTIQSVKDFFKEHWKSFYSDYVDKNDVLHAFDVLTNSGLTLYEQVQNLPSTTAGFLKAISEGTVAHIDAANKHLKNVKMKHRVTLAMALDTINKETMDKAHPDYLKQNGFDSWVNAFGAYLGAERLLEMNSIAKAQGEEYKLPKGLTEAELQQFVRNAPMQFKKAADIFYKVNDNMLSVMEDAGVFSHDLAQLLRTKYKKYCPLLRDFSDTAAADSFINGLTTGGRGIGNVSIPLKKISISGSERGVLNPLETVLKSYAVMLNRAERNKVGLMAVNSAKEAGMEDIIEEVPEIIGKNGEVVNAVADPKNCVFTVLVNGKKKAYKTTPELYGPIVGYNVPAAGLVFGVARTAAKMLRTGATMSPSFILRNVLRDTFFAGISSKNGFIPILDTLRGMNALLNDPAMRAEFEAAGVTEFNFYSSQEQRIKSIDAMAGEKPVGPLEMIKWAFRNLEAASDFMESATRMGEFMKARGKDLSIEEAARAAREVTIDFSRSGRVGEQINQVVPFFNACVQGGDKMRRLLREDFRGTATKLFKYIVLPSIFLWAMNYDEDWYKDLDPDIKNNYWCLGKNIRIPKPQEAGVLFGSGFEALLDQANGKDSKAMANWAKAFMSNMTPGIVPTLFLPLLEWQANYSYFKGRPLVSSKYQRLPDELQYNDYTSELSKSIGNNPLYKVSPMKVDNLVRGYTGTMGALLWSLPDYATDKAKNQPARNWYEYTPFRDFTVTDANMSRPLNDFYGMLDAANRQHAGYGVKGKPTQEVQAIRKTGTMISNIRKDIDKITKSKLTAERKRQLIDQRKAKMNQLARQANERYGKYFD